MKANNLCLNALISGTFGPKQNNPIVLDSSTVEEGYMLNFIILINLLFRIRCKVITLHIHFI